MSYIDGCIERSKDCGIYEGATMNMEGGEMKQRARPNPHSKWLRRLIWLQNYRIEDGERRTYEQGGREKTVSSRCLIRLWEKAVRQGNARRIG